MVVEPNVSVGPVHSGMTMQQVVTQLGEPDQKSDGKMLYGNLGFEVDFGPGGKVEQVVCSAGDNSGITKSFGGQTKEGIGIGATRAEVVRAYGNPAPIKSDQEQGAETMLYVSPGVAFQLSHDKVSMMYVRLMK